MSDGKVEQPNLLCEDCGQTFSEFLQEMADKNARVATCPNCGKIHGFSRPQENKPVAGGKTT
jgi:uncharacterized Zn finger protein